MAVIIWREGDGELTREVRSGRRVFLSAEEYRPEAEALDARLDALLDDALQLMEDKQIAAKPSPFLKSWSLGRAVALSRVLYHEAMRGEVISLLWEALAHKCWYGVRANASRESRWRGLRATQKGSERRVNPEKSLGNEFKYEDFEIGFWLADQELKDAGQIFGDNISNAKDLYRRKVLKSHELRKAILCWLQGQTVESQTEFSKGAQGTGGFSIIAKALNKRFPSRGPGSVRLPQHYEPKELQRIVAGVLDQARDEHFTDETDE